MVASCHLLLHNVLWWKISSLWQFRTSAPIISWTPEHLNLDVLVTDRVIQCWSAAKAERIIFIRNRANSKCCFLALIYKIKFCFHISIFTPFCCSDNAKGPCLRLAVICHRFSKLPSVSRIFHTFVRLFVPGSCLRRLFRILLANLAKGSSSNYGIVTCLY